MKELCRESFLRFNIKFMKILDIEIYRFILNIKIFRWFVERAGLDDTEFNIIFCFILPQQLDFFFLPRFRSKGGKYFITTFTITLGACVFKKN